MLQSGDKIIPGFKLDSFLGRGEFGQVWRAESPGGTYLALKFLDLREQQGRKEFRAVQRIKGIRHPHLLPTYAMWLLDDAMNVIEDTAFEDLGNSAEPLRGTMMPTEVTSNAHEPRMLVIATALCDKDLSQRLKECQEQGLPGIPRDELLEYMADAAKAIDFLNAPRHELGHGLSAIHHCDIKPANIMLVSGSAVVGDLGVARVFASAAHSVRATSVCGSLAYSAPEMFENRTEATTDQYALAITYYELRTGKLPFDATSFAQAMQEKTAGRLTFEGVSPAERKVLERATAVQPSQRYATSIEFVNELASGCNATPLYVRPRVRIARYVASISAVLAIAVIAVYDFNRPVVEKKQTHEKRSDELVRDITIDQNASTKGPDTAIDTNESMASPRTAVQDVESSVVLLDPSATPSANPTVERKWPSSESENEGSMPAIVVLIPEADAPVAGSSGEIAGHEVRREGDKRSIEAAFDETLESMIAAFHRGEPIPRVEALGSDADVWASELTSANFSTSPDGGSYVKAFQQTLCFQSMNDTKIRRCVEIDSLKTDIRHISWLEQRLVLSDDRNSLWQVDFDAKNLSTVDKLTAQPLLPELECYWIDIPDKNGVLVASRTTEHEPDTATPEGYLFDVSFRAEQKPRQKLTGLNRLSARTWPPMISCDRASSRILALERDRVSPDTFGLFDIIDQHSTDLSESTARDLSFVEQAIFLDDGGSLLLLGIRANESWKSVFWIQQEKDQATVVRRLSSEFGEPLVLEYDGHTGFIALRSNALTHCVHANGQWVERVINVSEEPGDIIQSMSELSPATIIDFVVAPRRWLLLVTEDSSLVAAKLYDVESDESDIPAAFDCFELGWQAPTETVARLDIAGDHLIATTVGGSSTWYQLEELLLIAEMRKRLGE